MPSSRYAAVLGAGDLVAPPQWASQAQNWSPCAGRVPLERCGTVRPLQRVHCVPPARLARRARLSCFSNLFFLSVSRLVSPAQCQPVIRAGRVRFLLRPMTCFRAPSACVLGGLAASSISRWPSAGLLDLPPARPLARGQMTVALISMRPGGPDSLFHTCKGVCITLGTDRVRVETKGGMRMRKLPLHGMRYVASILCCTLYLRPLHFVHASTSVRPQAEPNEGTETLKDPKRNSAQVANNSCLMAI